ncbi:Conserved oligomeric Golgi complex subunit [Coemansia thaxteri]|nr:Conserved oligomeric Golgi complex subunit [Coemansia thaxteri]
MSADGAEAASNASGSPEVRGSEFVDQQLEAKYGEFLSDEFDPARYAQLIASDSGASADGITQALGMLAGRAAGLERLLRQTVMASHEDLLQQVVGAKAVDASLGLIEDQVREIKAYMHGLRTRVRVPYEQALRYTNQAAHLQAATACVRATAKFMQLARRLQAQIPDAPQADAPQADAPRADYALAALTLLDIERLVASSDLAGVHVVDRALGEVVAPRRAATAGEAERLLGSGMRRQNQSDVGAGLQILFNLGSLPAAVAATVRRYTVEWAASVAGRVDPAAVHAQVREHNARATSADGSDMIGITAVVWARLEAAVDELAARGLELRVLERVLARKRDVLPRFDVAAADAPGGVAFLDLAVAQLGDRPLAFWWGTAVAALAAEIDAACRESSVIRQTLVNGYARLVQLFVPKLECILAPRLGGVVSAARAHQQPEPVLPGGVSYADHGPAVLWDRLLARFETEYVQRAATRIEDAVGRCYPPPPPPGLLDAQEIWSRRGTGSASARSRSGSAPIAAAAAAGSGELHAPADLEQMAATAAVPSRKLVAGVVRSISTELEMAKSDARLSSAVAAAASRAVASFVAVTGAKLAKISAGAFAASSHVLDPLDQSYVGLINAANALHTGLAGLLSEADESAAPKAFIPPVLGSSLQELDALIARHVDTLLNAADVAIVESLVADGASQIEEGEGASLQTPAPSFEPAMQWLQTQVLEPLDVDCHHRACAMVDRFLRVYTSAVCLTFPLTEDAKLRLTAESTQLEFACNQIITSSNSLVPGTKPQGLSGGGGGGGGGSSHALKLADLGASYRALRLIRPLLFVDVKELQGIAVGFHLSTDSWADLPLFDLIDHIVCRVATETNGSGDNSSFHSASVVPYVRLGWTRRQWIDVVTGSAENTDKHCLDTELSSARRALNQSLDVLLLDEKTAATAELAGLLQAAKGAFSAQ